MIEVQKERFQHLLANSILEMWKKETGSSLSILIEGTICITSCHGKVTVIQISSQFPGLADHDMLSPLEANASAKFIEHIKLARHMSVHEGHIGSVEERKYLSKEGFRRDNNNNEMSDSNEDEEMLDVVEDSSTPPNKRDSISGEEDRDVSSEDEKMRDDKTDNCNDSVNDSAIHDVSGQESSEDQGGDSIEKELKSSRFSHESDVHVSSPLLYASQVQGTVGVESVLKNHLLNKHSNFLPHNDKSSPSPESEPPKSHSPENNRMENFTSRVKFPISPMWPIKKEMNDKITSFEEKFNPLKHSSPICEMQNHFMANTILSGFIPAAHSSNLNNYLRLHSLPPMMSPSAVKELTNRSFSVPVFSPADERPFDLAGRNLTTSAPSCRTDSSSAPATATNNEQKIYKCLFCQKTFLFKSKYHEHLPVHTSARPFQCHLCSRTYKYKYDLRVHLRTHLGIPTKSTICPFCSNKFTTNKQLRQHIRDEHNEQQRISDEQCAQSLLMALPSA